MTFQFPNASFKFTLKTYSIMNQGSTTFYSLYTKINLFSIELHILE